MKKLIANFTWRRAIRILAGILLMVQAFITKEPLYGFIAAFFLFTGLANVSCCGSGGSCTLKTNIAHSIKDTTNERLDLK